LTTTPNQSRQPDTLSRPELPITFVNIGMIAAASIHRVGRQRLHLIAL
jgi:hypothetical protein